MKSHHLAWSILAASAMCLCSPSCAVQPAVYVIDRFDSPSSVDSWFVNWSITPVTMQYDSADTGGGPAGSGSMKVTADFAANSQGFGIARMLSSNPWDGSVSVPASAYAYFSMDIRWSPGSMLDGTGMLPSYMLHGINPSYQVHSPERIVTSPNGDFDWVHAVVPVNDLTSGADLTGILYRMWGGDPSGPMRINQPVTFWLDNLELTNVPEPSSFALLISGGLFLRRFRGSTFQS